MTTTAPKRILFTIAFDGSSFHGWQSQPHGETVQDALEKAFRTITQERVRIEGASRTDAGVHALSFPCHVDTQSDLAPEKLLLGLNALLPPTIVVREANYVPADFHARKSVQEKTYRYFLLNERRRSPHLLGRVWQLPQPLSLSAMQEAAAHFVGTHDFSCFQGSDDNPRNPVRTMNAASVTRAQASHHLPLPMTDNLFVFEFRSRGFLKYMVRNMVGTLVEVGMQKRASSSIPDILAGRDRTKAGGTAPAEGLYLMEVRYAPEAMRLTRE